MLPLRAGNCGASWDSIDRLGSLGEDPTMDRLGGLGEDPTEEVVTFSASHRPMTLFALDVI